MPDRGGVLVGVVLEEELREAEAREGNLRPETDLRADFERLVVVLAGFGWSAEEAPENGQAAAARGGGRGRRRR